MKRTAIGGGLYERKGDGTFWIRPTVNGERTWRKLGATTKRYARSEVLDIEAKRRTAKNVSKPDPLSVTQSTTLKDLFATYVEEGCPTKRLEPRTPKQIAYETRSLQRVLEFLGDENPANIGRKDCSEYRNWRRTETTFTRGSGPNQGNRTIDLELTSLSNLLSWAAAEERIESNPIARDRARCVKEEHVVHCRERAPKSADEIHRLALEFFARPQSEVLGWQMFLEAFTGCRTGEILKLRMDARSKDEPGYIEGNYLYLNRSKKGTNPFVLIHPALGQLIRAHHEWHRVRFPGEISWWLPGRGLGPHVSKNALTHGLRRICPNLDMETYTSHGMRSFYVTVRRSQGIPDYQIAAEIGHRSGGELIRRVYGDCPPPTPDGQGRAVMSWLPSSGEPAWSTWTPVPEVKNDPDIQVTAQLPTQVANP